MEKWPNFFIVGTPKAATTSLHSYLNSVPEIFMSPRKEPNYFSVSTVPNNHPFRRPIRDKNQYLELFNGAKNEIIRGESSTDYLADPDSASLIHKLIPHAKILISLRDPVEREFSHYCHLLRRGFMQKSFHHELEKQLKGEIDFLLYAFRLDVGLYALHVNRFLKIFGSNQVKIIIYEEFIHDTKKFVKEITNFLGLQNAIIDFQDEIHNPFLFVESRNTITKQILESKKTGSIAKKIIPKFGRDLIRNNVLQVKKLKPKLEQVDREKLIEFYYDDVKKLESLLGRRLPWSNFQ